MLILLIVVSTSSSLGVFVLSHNATIASDIVISSEGSIPSIVDLSEAWHDEWTSEADDAAAYCSLDIFTPRRICV